MSKKPQKTEAKFVRNFVANNEAKAKDLAAEKLGIPHKLLKANHTDKLFVFSVR